MIAPARADAAVDVTASGTVLALGKGWYPLETARGRRFRWCSERAEFRLAVLDAARYTFELEVEAGPGVAFRPFLLSVFDDDGKPVQSARVIGRERIALTVGVLPPGIHRFSLRCEGGGARLSDDPRALEYRVFAFHAIRAEPDVTPPAVRLLAGWYALETYNGETFRWVNNDAVLSVPSGQPPFELLVESGPGFDYGPFRLDLRGAARASLAVERRTALTIDGAGDYTLHVEGGGKRAPRDHRMLNFRVLRGA